MSKVKSNNALIGRTFVQGGQKYRIQKIEGQIVYASKMVSDDKCQKGRPNRFDLNKVLALIGVVEAPPEPEPVVQEPIKMEDDDDELIDVIIPTKVEKTEEERKNSLARLLALHGEDPDPDW